MGRQFLHIEEDQPVLPKNPFHGEKRKIREMLMIDRIELILFHQSGQMGKLHGDQAVGLQRRFQPADKIVQVGVMGQNIVSDDQIGLLPFIPHLQGIGMVKKCDFRGDVLFPGRMRGIRRRLDPEHGNVVLFEILQKIAVVAGNLYDKLILIQPKAFDHHIDIALTMLEPTVGKGGKIGISGMKNVPRLFKLLQLHQQAVFTNIHIQRVIRLHLLEILCAEV